MEVNLVSILYTVFRISPIVIAVLFILSDFIWKGLVYSIGLIFSLVVNYIIFNKKNQMSVKSCDEFQFFHSTFGFAPLTTIIMAYTISYLALIYFYHNDIINNSFILILFLGILVLDILWNLKYNCYSFSTLMGSVFATMIMGIIWSYTIESSSINTLSPYNNNCRMIGNKYVCKPLKSDIVSDPPPSVAIRMRNEPNHTHSSDNVGTYYDQHDNVSNYLPTKSSSHSWYCDYDCQSYITRYPYLQRMFGNDCSDEKTESDVLRYFKTEGKEKNHNGSGFGCREHEKKEGFESNNIFSKRTSYDIRKKPTNVVPAVDSNHLLRSKFNKNVSTYRIKNRKEKTNADKKNEMFQDAIIEVFKSIQKTNPNLNHNEIQQITDYLQGKHEIISSLSEEQISIAKLTAIHLKNMGYDVY